MRIRKKSGSGYNWINFFCVFDAVNCGCNSDVLFGFTSHINCHSHAAKLLLYLVSKQCFRDFAAAASVLHYTLSANKKGAGAHRMDYERRSQIMSSIACIASDFLIDFATP